MSNKRFQGHHFKKPSHATVYVRIQLHHLPSFTLFEIAHGCRYPLNYFSIERVPFGFLGVSRGCRFRIKNTSDCLTCVLTHQPTCALSLTCALGNKISLTAHLTQHEGWGEAREQWVRSTSRSTTLYIVATITLQRMNVSVCVLYACVTGTKSAQARRK